MKSYIQNYLKELTAGKSIAILGFGREGKSTYQVLNKLIDSINITILDQKDTGPFFNENHPDSRAKIIYGENYLSDLSTFDLIFKSPGISLNNHPQKNILFNKLVSQSKVFLKLFRSNIIGVTGTKGKSTTVSLLHSVFYEKFGDDVFLVGNIGRPAFDVIESITSKSLFIYEFSSYQLEAVNISPKFAILLNIFPEHLDFYNSYEDYIECKLNIFKHQKNGDVLFIGDKFSIPTVYQNIIDNSQGHRFSLNKGIDENIQIHLKDGCIYWDHKLLLNIDKFNKLPGEHNLYNTLPVIAMAKTFGIPISLIEKGIEKFKGLPHRLEFVGHFRGISFYDDSISTIPQTTMSAVKSFKHVDILIFGGLDRGVDYSEIVSFLASSNIHSLILLDDVGKIIYEMKILLTEIKNVILVNTLEEAVINAFKLGGENDICLLSPGAASYNMFSNFEERGNTFKKLVVEYGKK